jgi:protein TonB
LSNPSRLARVAFTFSVALHALLLGFLWAGGPAAILLRAGEGFQLTLSPFAFDKPKPRSASCPLPIIHFTGDVSLKSVSLNPKLDDSHQAVVSDPEKSAEGISPDGISAGAMGIRASYPVISRRLGEEGRLVLELRGTDSNIEPTIIQSSGFERLDKAAIDAVQTALKDPGQAVRLRAGLRINFIFKLKD